MTSNIPAKSNETTDGDNEQAVRVTTLAPLFRLDFLRLLKYHEVERCRLINHAYDRTAAPVHIRPTFSHFWLRQIVWRKRTQTDGIMDGRHLRDSSEKRQNWVLLTKGLRCCNGLRAEVRPLIGQMVFLNGPAQRVVWIEVTNEKGDRIALGICNQLTADTAFHFVHFLKHLHGAFFDSVSISIDQWMARGFGGIRVNPDVFHFTSASINPRVELHCRMSQAQLQQLPAVVRGAIEAIFNNHLPPADG